MGYLKLFTMTGFVNFHMVQKKGAGILMWHRILTEQDPGNGMALICSQTMEMETLVQWGTKVHQMLNIYFRVTMSNKRAGRI
jgi:hypothetical protein